MTIRGRIMLSNILIILIPAIMTLLFAFIFLYSSLLSVQGGNVIAENAVDFISDMCYNPVLLRNIITFFLLCILSFAVSVIIGTSVLSKQILIPIRELTSAAYKIKGGELDFELLGTDCHEIKSLCYAFDDMRMQLKESRAITEKQIHDRKLMLANISHDIKTPLTSIKGYISGIHDGIADTPEKIQKYLDTIYKKTEIIESMINNMSDFSMLELSRMKFDFEYGDIKPLVTAMAEEYNSENKNVHISVNLPEEEIAVKIDYAKMRRVFSNIIDNSIKYRKNDKANITVSAEHNEKGYIIAFSDDGIGIENENIAHIFDSFYRADPSRTPNIKGSGLGLSITKEIVEKHGGKIWIKSELNSGTTVFIFLAR